MRIEKVTITIGKVTMTSKKLTINNEKVTMEDSALTEPKKRGPSNDRSPSFHSNFFSKSANLLISSP